MVIDSDWEKWDHQLCIIDEVVKLMNRGFVCYLEYEIPFTKGYRKKFFVDIFAIKGKEKVLLEIGTLSQRQKEDRLRLLKILMPNMKLIHIHQWKNYGITEDVIKRAGESWRWQILMYGKILNPNLGNDWFSGCFNYKELDEDELMKIERIRIHKVAQVLE